MKTIREEKVGKTTLRLVQMGAKYAGIVFLDGKTRTRVDGCDPDDVWQDLRGQAATTSPSYVGFEGAINRFKSFFPDGFRSAEYTEQERDYKLKAKHFLDTHVPIDTALNGRRNGDAIKSTFNRTNLLSQFEKMRLIECLSSKEGDAFIKGAATMASGDIQSGLRMMENALTPHNAAKWTVVTYLPYLWKPESHMFLKPEVTKDFAERVGHPFHTDYDSKLKPEVYESLLDLTAKTEQEISSLEPQDRIDVQSFIWVVGAYGEDDVSGRNG